MKYDPSKYISWIPKERLPLIKECVSNGSYLPDIVESEDGVSPEQAMMEWESKGMGLPDKVSDRLKLALYYDGKIQRDFHVREWKKAVKADLFVPEEFLGCLGCDIEEFRGVFGRLPDLRAFKRVVLVDAELAQSASGG